MRDDTKGIKVVELDSDELEKLLMGLSGETPSRIKTTIPEVLIELYKVLQKEHTFSKGQLVRWKEHMRNAKSPDYGAPAIVTQVCEPFFDESQGMGTPYYKEPLDIRIGMMDREGDFLEFWANSKRFEPYIGDVIRDDEKAH